jgi:GNAT superfamily N-acetyltransferase
VVGLASLHILELFHEAGRLGRITSFVVDVNSRKQGVGKALVAAADEFFRRSGCVRAEVSSGNHRLAAHVFYASQGYVPEECRFLKRFD